MYPSVTPAAGLPAGFETLIAPAKSLLLSADEAAALRDGALGEWLDALSQ
jgi:thiamine transport system substrate-binding protein